MIAVALFLERPVPQPQLAPASLPGAERHRASSQADAGRYEQDSAGPLRAPPDELLRDKQAAHLGTGHGARGYSSVSRTAFVRRSGTPSDVVRIRYDRYDNLVTMGVVQARPASPTPNPFPESGRERYVPDPPGL